MQYSFGQVTVTSAGLQNFCVDEDFISIPSIVISETTSGDFADNNSIPRTYEINAPANFQFDTNFGDVSFTGDDITFADIVVQTNRIRIIYVDQGNNSALLESLTIFNIRVKAINMASGSVNLLRTGGNADQLGNAIADSNAHAVFASFTPPQAGVSTNTTICITETAFDLFTSLTGEQSGGVWQDDNATGALSGNFFNASAVSTGTYNFTYQVSSANCPDDTETVSITVEAAVSAGNGTNRNICVSNDNFNLFTTLAGFNTGGTWTDDDLTGQLLGNSLDATSLTPGSSYNFTYTVNGMSCTDSETVTITIDPLNNAGTALAPASICNTEVSFDLFSLLSGEDTGGTWTNNTGAAGFTGTAFNPSLNASGMYSFTYTVANSVCNSDSETISITINPLPQANTINEEICDDGIGSLTENTSIDLVSDYNALITSSNNVTITWHTGSPTTAGNQLGNTTSSTPTITNSSIFYARIENNSTLCVNEGSITFQLNQLPVSLDFSYELCEQSSGANSAAANLNDYVADVSNNAAGVSITWYNDAALNFPVFTPTNQTVGSGSEYFARVVNNTTFCESVAKIDFTINSLPVAPTAAIVNNSFCVGNDASVSLANAVSGTNLKWYTSSDLSTQVATGSTPSLSDLSISTVSSGNFKRYVTQTDIESCESSALEINFSIFDAPVFDPIPVNISACTGELINIDFTTFSGADNISWTADNADVGNPLSGTDNINFLTVANNTTGNLVTTITVSAINQGCSTPITTQFTITLFETPVIPNLFPPISVCENISNFDLTSINLNASPGGGTYSYSGNGITGSIFDATNASVSLGVQVIDVIYETIDGCIISEQINLLDVVDAPTADAGLSVGEVCVNSSFTVTDAVVSHSTGILWTHNGNGTLLNETTISPTYSPNILDAGSNITLTLTANGFSSCATAADTKLLTITPVPVVDAGSDTEICASETSFDLANAITDASASEFASLLWSTSGTGSFDDATALLPVYTPTPADKTAGNVTLTLTAVGNGSCTDVSNDMILTFTTVPVVDAGSDTEICASETSFDLANAVTDASASEFASLLWSTSGTGSFDDATALLPVYTPTPADKTAGNVTLTLTAIGNGSCTDVSNDMILTFTPVPVVDAGSDTEICASETSFDLANAVTDASASEFASLLWSTSGTGSFDDATALLPVYTPTPADKTAGNVTLTLTAVGNGSCTDVSNDMILTFTPVPVVDAGSDTEICASETSFDLANAVTDASASEFASLLWSTSGTGSFDDATALLPVYTPTPADKTAGTVTLTLTAVGNGSCTDVSNDMILTFTPVPVVNAGSDSEICASETSFDLANAVTDASASEFASLLWSTSGTGSFDDATALLPVYTPTPADKTAGTVTLTLTAEGNGTCIDVSNDMILTFTPVPVVDAGSDSEICASETSFDLANAVTDASASEFASLLWSTSGTGSFDDATALLPVYTPTPADKTAGNVTLTLTAVGNGSCTDVSNDMILTFTPVPVVDAGSDTEICASETSFDLANAVTDASASEFASLLWSTSGTGSFDDATALLPVYTPTPADKTAGTVTLTLTAVGNGSCTDVSNDMILTFTPVPVVNAGSDSEICASETSFDLANAVTDASASEFASLLWSTSGTGSFDDATALLPVYTPTPADKTAGTVTLTLTAEGNGTCIDVSNDMILTFTPVPVVDAGSDSEICASETSFDLANAVTDASASEFASLLWSTSGTGSFDDATALLPVYTPTPADKTAGTVTLTLTAVGNGSCTDVSNDMLLTIKPVPTINSLVDLVLCPAEVQASIPFTADLSGGAFSWSVTNFSQLGLASGSGTGDFPSFTPQPNATGANLNSEVTVSYVLNACLSVNETFTITTKPTPIIDDIADVQVCPGETVAIEFNANTSGEIFNWDTDNITIGIGLSANGSGNISFVAEENNSGIPIVSTFTYSATLNACESVIKTFSVTLNPEPVVNSISDIEVCSFESIQTNFSSNVPGASFSWVNDNPASGIPASGTGNFNTNAVENLTGADIVSNIQVKGAQNSCEGAIETFTVTVKPKPIITAVTDIEVCSEDIISEIIFSDNSGGNSTITWAATNSANIGLPSNSGSGSIPQFTAAQNSGTTNITSTITVTSTWNGCISDQLIFRIILKPTPLMTTVSNIVACGNDPILTNFSNSLGGSTTYSWTNNAPEIGLSATGTGNLNINAVENTTGSPITATIIVTPLNNGCIGPNMVFTITVNPTPQISSIADVAICADEVVSIPFTVDIIGTNLSISNSNSSIVIDPPIINNGNVEFTTATNTSGADITGVFEIRSSNLGCVGVESFTVTLKNKPVVRPEPDEPDLCATDNVSPRLFSHISGSGDFTWEITNTALIGDATASSGAGNFPGFELVENISGQKKIGYVKFFSTRNGCLSEEDSFKITLNPSPVTSVNDTVYCAGDFVNYQFLSNTDGNEVYEWTNISGNTSIGINNLTGTSTNGYITQNDFPATNNDPLNDNVAVFEVYSIKDGCPGPVETFEIRVKPRPVLSSGLNYNPQTCSGDNFIFEPSANLPNTNFTWELQSAPTSVTGAIPSGDGTVELQLENSSNANQVVVYRITPVNNNCPGTSRNLNITVYPDIQFSPSIPDNYRVCTGSTFTIPLTIVGDIPGITYEWQVSNNTAGATNGSGTSVSGQLSNSRPFPETDTVYYTITPTLNNGICKGPSTVVAVVINPEERFRVGDNLGDNTFCASEPKNLIPSNTGGGVFSGPGVVLRGNQYVFDPTLAGIADFYPITYTVTNQLLGCTSVYTENVYVIPAPQLNITYENNCDIENGVTLNFINTYDNAEDQIIEYRWLDPINNTVSIVENDVVFRGPGNRQIVLEVETALGCTFRSQSFNIEVWNITKADFTFTDNNTPGNDIDFMGTQFSDISTSDGNSEIIAWSWEFIDPVLETTLGTSNEQNPKFIFESEQQYEVKLTITVALNEGDPSFCQLEVSKNVDIVESVFEFPYFRDFEVGPAGWNPQTIVGDSASWKYIQVENAFRNIKNSSRSWGTIRNGKAGYKSGENSILNTASFNLTKLDRPMIAFDVWIDFRDAERDGLIVEYSIDGTVWQVLGEANDAFNWYNYTGHLGQPGGSVEAWSYVNNESWKWKRVAYPLDSFMNNTAVSFRFNFKAQNNENATGVAIDNFYIGERTKNVLVENFTNINADDFNNTQQTLSQYLEDPILSKDIIPLNFHTTYPRPDALSRRNNLELDSRAALYSINSSSVHVFDGNRMSDLLFNDEYRKVIRARSLLDSKADEEKTTIELAVDNSAGRGVVKFDANITIDTAVANNQELAIYYFIVDKFARNIEGTNYDLQNVVVKTLPDINGHILSGVNTLNEPYEWQVNNLENETSLAIVTVIQDLNTNEVIQTTITEIAGNKVDDILLSNKIIPELSNISIYPNPSKDKFVIEVPSDFNKEIHYKVIDNIGKVVLSNKIDIGEKTHELHLKGVSTGIYNVFFKDDSGNMAKMKIVLID